MKDKVMPRAAVLIVAMFAVAYMRCDREPTPVVVQPSDPTQDTPRLSPVVAEVLKIHNDNRQSPLTINPLLTLAAQRHAAWMAEKSRMSHRGDGGSKAGERIKSAGYDWTTYGENVAYGQETPAEVMGVWLRSPGHRRNIKSGAFNEIGIGVATSANGDLYWCVTFGATTFGADDEWDESEAEPEFEPTRYKNPLWFLAVEAG